MSVRALDHASATILPFRSGTGQGPAAPARVPAAAADRGLTDTTADNVVALHRNVTFLADVAARRRGPAIRVLFSPPGGDAA